MDLVEEREWLGGCGAASFIVTSPEAQAPSSAQMSAAGMDNSRFVAPLLSDVSAERLR